jgi:hypothetical protein
LDENQRFWCFAGSYFMVPAAWTNDSAVTTQQLNYMSQWGGWFPVGPVSAGNNYLGHRKLSAVLFPSQKICIFDEADRHFSRSSDFVLYPDVSQPYQFFDGSVRVVKTGDINLGSHPTGPESALLTTVSFTPTNDGARRGATLRGGATTETFSGTRFMSTRYGLRGVDVGGAEVRSQ